MSEESGEKQFDPTPKRKADAAKKGDVLRSKEVGTAVAILAGTAWLYVLGGWLMDGMKSLGVGSASAVTRLRISIRVRPCSRRSAA